MRISYLCPTCGARNRLTGSDLCPPRPACRRCDSRLSLAAPEAAPDAGAPTRCVVCGDDKFFIQKSFDQRVGCLIVGAGAALVPWTYGLSLAVCALADLALYRFLPMITVCYICGARYDGGGVTDPDHRPYDLMTAQTYEARSMNWRRRHDRTSDATTPPVR